MKYLFIVLFWGFPASLFGDLVISTPSSFPASLLASNSVPLSRGNALEVEEGLEKGQSFSLGSESSVTGFVFQVDQVVSAGNFGVKIYDVLDGLPWVSSPLLSEEGELPAGIGSGDFLQVLLPSALALPRGSYSVVLTGVAGADFSLVTSGGDAYGAGLIAARSAPPFWQPAMEGNDLVFGVLGSASSPTDRAPAGAPNIIFIMADDFGWTDLRTGMSGPNVLKGVNYGSDFYETPNLARLASEGLSFTHCFVQPNCAPTRAAILSGQYSPRSGNGVYAVTSLNRPQEGATEFIGPGQREDPSPDHTLLSESLRGRGYVTAHVGKYHVGNKNGGLATMPENQGFDYNFGGNEKGAPGSYHAVGEVFASQNIGPGLDAFAYDFTVEYINEVLVPYANGSDPLTELTMDPEKHVERAIGDAALAFMNDHLKGALSDRPFFLQVHPYASHGPVGDVHAPVELLAKYRALPGGIRHFHPNFAALVESVDQTVGRILDYLSDPNGDGDEADSIADETMIVFTTDNGGTDFASGPATDNDPLRHLKGSFYNGGIRVPLIVRWPGSVVAGSQTDSLVHAVDFYPTLHEAAGLAMPAGIRFDGTSFMAHALSPTGTARDRESIFYHFPGYLDHRARPCEVVISRIEDRDYKLIYNYDPDYVGAPNSVEDNEEGLKVLSSNWELYDYSRDLGERNNLLDGSYSNWLLYGEVATMMADELTLWLGQGGSDWNAALLTNRSTGQFVPFPGSAGLEHVEAPGGKDFKVVSFGYDMGAEMVTIAWNAEAGFLYDIQVSDDLQMWWTVDGEENIVGENGELERTFSSTASDRRFVRIRLHD